MTDQELKSLAREYAEKNNVDFHDILIATRKAKQFLRWLTKTHCIVSREKVSALEDNIHGNIMYAHDEDDWQEAAHYILDVMPRRFIAVFGERPFDNPKTHDNE